MSRIVVVGGVAAGMSAASQPKRPQLEAEVVVLECGPCVSYAACGMPYNIEDPARTVARKRLHAVRRREAATVGRDVR